jgi:hypothetical protein
VRKQARDLRRTAQAWWTEHGWRRRRHGLPLPDHLIALPSTEGVRLLAEAIPIGDYLRLSPWFETQESPNFCGPTTIAMLLNMLDAPPPPGRFTQHSVFTSGTSALRSRDTVVRQGMPLPVFADYLAAHAVEVVLRYARDIDVDAFRAEAIAVLDDPHRGMAVNYLRSALGQEGRGHLSPLAAFHPASDRFLVLDVSRYRYPPAWVRTADLFDAMNTAAGRRSRGYVIAAR